MNRTHKNILPQKAQEPKGPSAVWHSPLPDMADRLESCIDAACDEMNEKGPGYIFFRADDVAAPGKTLFRLMELFMQYRLPLALAVVPAWLTVQRWQCLKRYDQKAPELWCWHQHGWRHINNEKRGKKQEFGPKRPLFHLRRDLLQGKKRLENLMDGSFCPIFTPPWNRCSLNTLKVLIELDYHAVSRFRGSLPRAPAGLPDLQANVDLHTRKQIGWDRLFSDLREAISSGLCGIMIHHGKMNDMAFRFLESLLICTQNQKRLIPVHFNELKGYLTSHG